MLPLRRVWIWERWQERSVPHSPKLQHYWNLTIRLFSHIPDTRLRRRLIPQQRCSRCILQPQPIGPDKRRQSGKGDPLGIVQEIKIWPYYRMVCAKPESIQKDRAHKILWDFEIETNYLIPTGRPDLVLINKKKYFISWILLIRHNRIKIKEKENIDKYMDLVRELKKKAMK